MGTITTKDGTEICYEDWGKGQPIVFSHGWPLSADDWDTQMLFFLKHGYRVIAHDRRGHGRSTQVSDGHDMDHYADDLAALTAHLDLKNAIHVGQDIYRLSPGQASSQHGAQGSRPRSRLLPRFAVRTARAGIVSGSLVAEARRSPRSTANKIRIGHQSENGQGAWHHRATDAARSCRRGDRIAEGASEAGAISRC
jgi:pimeloyl-ACP methyl ester carboxylesterase